MIRKRLLSVIILLSLLGCVSKEEISLDIKTESVSEISIEMARQFFSEGNYEEAIEVYIALIDIDPNNTDAWMGLAETYVIIEEYEKAENAYISLVDIDSNNVTAWLGLANTYKKEGKYSEAENAYQTVVEKDDSNIEGWKELSKIYIDNGRYEEFLNISEKLIEIDSDNPDNYLYTGILTIVNGDIKISESYLNKASSLYDNIESNHTAYEEMLKMLSDSDLTEIASPGDDQTFEGKFYSRSDGANILIIRLLNGVYSVKTFAAGEQMLKGIELDQFFGWKNNSDSSFPIYYFKISEDGNNLIVNGEGGEISLPNNTTITGDGNIIPQGTWTIIEGEKEGKTGKYLTNEESSFSVFFETVAIGSLNN